MKFRVLLRSWCIGVSALAVSAAGVWAEKPAPRGLAPERAGQNESAEHDYVRYVGDNIRGKLETAVVTMKNAAGVSVELVGAVHIADAAYYKLLMQLFGSYETLLFELVDGQRLKESVEGLPKKARAAKRSKPAPAPKDEAAEEPVEEPAEREDAAFGVLRWAMQGIGNYLRLQYQTDGIDYHTKNFVHADVSMEEFQRLQSEKGESFMMLFQKAFEAQLGRSAQPDEQPTGGQLLLALLGDSSGIKIAMARMLAKAEAMAEQLGFGADSVIVGERNRVALEVFDREVKRGRKNLGIFYGAAHLSDLEDRLEQRGYRRTGERWVTAWDIKPRTEEAKEKTRK